MLNLETAQSPQKFRRVATEPVTRVEGHGKVTILLDDENRVHQVRLHIVEFRGFEVFIRGRPYWEVPVAVQRLCGICPVSHLLAATKAMDLIAGFGPLTPTAEKLRRLLHYGQIVQSHALHFFHLSSPDLLFGFESEAAKRNIIGVAAAFPGSGEARRHDPQVRAGSDPPYRRKAHPRHGRHPGRHEQGAEQRRSRFDALRD
jgi:NAD-reducing hydrogenase large subunit